MEAQHGAPLTNDSFEKKASASGIEGIFDDFGELVKWHLVHIVTGFFAAAKLLKTAT